MKYVLATTNPGKVAEMSKMLSELGFDFVTRDALGIGIDVEETGDTFLENATLKARAICRESGMPAIADDSGLTVEALGGEPGVYTSSYGGEELTASEHNLFLLSKMKNTEHRAAKFVSTIVCAFPNGDLISAVGECQGTIATEQRGTGGFGYDPVFIPAGSTKTMSELNPDEKNAVSHRGKSLREFAKVLREYYA